MSSRLIAVVVLGTLAVVGLSISLQWGPFAYMRRGLEEEVRAGRLPRRNVWGGTLIWVLAVALAEGLVLGGGSAIGHLAHSDTVGYVVAFCVLFAAWVVAGGVIFYRQIKREIASDPWNVPTPDPPPRKITGLRRFLDNWRSLG